jgi:hypothetical protein
MIVCALVMYVAQSSKQTSTVSCMPRRRSWMPILHLHAKDLVDFAELACVLRTEAQRSARSALVM